MVRLSYDIHLHSCLSPCADDDMTPGNIAGMASLIGLKLLALTDHNSCKNCPAFLTAAGALGLLALPGMELTTTEEVHVLCYFENLSDAMGFDSYVEHHILPVKNQPQLFGNQLICNEADEISGSFDTLLISATDISYFELPDLLKTYHGVMVPAHVDKQSNSLIGNLGFIPEGSRFSCCEFHDLRHAPAYLAEHPYLNQCRLLCSSDAHQLTMLHEAEFFLELKAADNYHVIKFLKERGISKAAFTQV